MATDEDLARVAAVIGDMLDRPGEGRGGIVDVGRILRLRAEPVVGRHDRDSRPGQAFADLGAVFRTQVLAAVLQAAAVEPDVGRETLGAHGHGEVELAALLLVRRERNDVIFVGDVLQHLGLDRPGRGAGETEQQESEAHQAISDWTILP